MQTATKQTLKIFWQHSNRYKGSVAVLVVGILVVTAINVIRPLFYKDIFNVLVGSNPQKTTLAIHILWIILALGLLNQLVWRIMGFVNSFYQSRVMSDL